MKRNLVTDNLAKQWLSKHEYYKNSLYFLYFWEPLAVTVDLPTGPFAV